ncbi:MAG: sulfatase family protein [Planctomycetota bacterium]|jgi:arylsulfatase A-like enzyme
MAGGPNVLVIYADQHRADCLGAYGNSDIRTPALDALAAEGIVFENCFCSYPVCTPSRYSFLSGVYVHKHAGWTNRCTLSPEIDTFPKAMQRAGYSTAAVGKMHFTPTYLDVGFDRMLLCEQDGDGRWDDDYHRGLMRLGLADVDDLVDQRREYRRRAPDEYWETFGAKRSNLDEERHSTTWIGERAVEEIESWSGSGNLLMAGFVKPHHPFDPPGKWFDMYDPRELTLLPGWTEACLERDLELHKGYFPHENLTEEALRRAMAAYYATISQIDHWCGKMIDALRSRGMYEDAMVVYTADHGDFMGHHHMLLKGNHMYDPLVRVPLIVKHPGSRAATRSSELVSCVDLAPTVLGVAGLERSPAMKGLDLAAGDRRNVVFAEARGGRHVMARSRDRKLLAEGDRDFLFDLERDPCELADVSGDAAYADDLAELRTAVGNWRDPSRLPKTHLDEQAPVIRRPNVPARDDGYRDRIAAWYGARVDATGLLRPE